MNNGVYFAGSVGKILKLQTMHILMLWSAISINHQLI